MYGLKNKYNANFRYYNNVKYDSQIEARYAQQLDFMLLAKQIKKVERQVRVTIKVKGCKICDMIVDFRVTRNDGVKEYHEVKGYPTPEWRLKRKLFEAVYPKRVYKVITQVRI